MNTLSDPVVAELIERLHRQADAQLPELRNVIATMAENESETWTEQLRDFYLPVNREQGRFLYQAVRAHRGQG
jgi:hypothetical protein